MNEGVYRALLIGNSMFPKDPHNLFELKGPSNDLALLSAALVHRASGLFAKKDVRVVAEKTKREITRAVEWFYRSAGFDDTLLLYYSGHGKTDEMDQLFLCARDTSTDLLVSTGISDAEIDGMMKRSSARRFVVILDCCHSGAFKSGGLPMRLKGTGRFLLTSSRRGEPSRDAEHPDEPSVFTRHLVEALLTGADRDGDGYVSVNETYEQVLEALRRETKQIPQRQFDRTIGDVALARAVAAAKPPRPKRPGRSAPKAIPRPVLAVSPPEIVISDVGADEELPAEIIDVRNDGDGDLDWTATSEADWIKLTKYDTYCELRLRPSRPGVNRANVRIRDAGRGGASTVRVVVKVRPADDAPNIEVTPTELDFGVLPRNSDSPLQTLLLKTTGSGIDAVASSDAPWLTVDQKDDVVNVSVDTSTAKELSGHVVVKSSAGDRVVPVRAIIEQGPVLRVKPKTIDFGRTTHGTLAKATVRVTNGRGGELEWGYRKQGAFFGVKRAGNSLTVTLAAPAGNHVGSIAIMSNAGNAVVDVHARVAAKPKPRTRKTVPATTMTAKKPVKTTTAARLDAALVRHLDQVGLLKPEEKPIETCPYTWAFVPRALTGKRQQQWNDGTLVVTNSRLLLIANKRIAVEFPWNTFDEVEIERLSFGPAGITIERRDGIGMSVWIHNFKRGEALHSVIATQVAQARRQGGKRASKATGAKPATRKRAPSKVATSESTASRPSEGEPSGGLRRVQRRPKPRLSPEGELERQRLSNANWAKFIENHRPGDVIEGKIGLVVGNHASVSIAPGVTAALLGTVLPYLPRGSGETSISRLMGRGRLRTRDGTVISSGDTVRVRIEAIDPGQVGPMRVIVSLAKRRGLLGRRL